MKNAERDLLDILEDTQVRLSEDIQTLGYIQDEYFIYDKPKNSFKHEYNEIQNKLMSLSKSMIYNRNSIKDYISSVRRW